MSLHLGSRRHGVNHAAWIPPGHHQVPPPHVYNSAPGHALEGPSRHKGDNHVKENTKGTRAKSEKASDKECMRVQTQATDERPPDRMSSHARIQSNTACLQRPLATTPTQGAHCPCIPLWSAQTHSQTHPLIFSHRPPPHPPQSPVRCNALAASQLPASWSSRI